MNELLALVIYFSFVLTIGICSSRKVKTEKDFILGNRSLNYVLTAMAAHASDMSSWLFMGYPAIIFVAGLFNAWVGVGLLLFMWLNWTYVAPKIRTVTEKLETSTLSSFFEKMVGDQSGSIRLVSAILCFVFYSVYLCAGLVGLGILGESMLGLNYFWGISLGMGFVFLYISLGGYVALAWLDLFQGIFLLLAVLFVPIYIGIELGGMPTIETFFSKDRNLLNMMPDYSPTSIYLMTSLAFGWGLGYFGQPAILTKFMGIKDSSKMHKSRNIGMTWMTLALAGATGVGLLAIMYFPQGLQNPETLFIEMTKQSLHPFVSSLILCAIIAATINVMSSQLLVMSSTITEDLFSRSFISKLSSKNKLLLSRLSVLCIALVVYIIACLKMSSVFLLVKYAWSGLGASFGPLVLILLYKKNVSSKGALAGLIVGGVTTALWPLVNTQISIQIDSMVPGYIFSIFAILGVSKLSSFSALPLKTESHGLELLNGETNV